LKKLKNLDLAECTITDRGLGRLSALPKLRKLDVMECRLLTSRGMQKLKNALSKNKLKIHALDEGWSREEYYEMIVE